MEADVDVGLLRTLGVATIGTLRDVGAVAVVLGRTLHRLMTTPLEWREALRALARYGPESMVVVMGAACFAGAIMVLQGAVYVERYGAQSLVGWYTGFVTLREVGPLLMGLMFSGRVGASHTAELAAMRVREQLDGLEIVGLDPFAILIVPRTLAMVVGLGMLAILGDVAALVSGATTARVLLGIDAQTFLRSMTSRLGSGDLFLGLEKALAFGLVIAVVSTHVGLSAKPTSQGVGRAVNRQVVLSALGMFAVDAALTMWAS